MPGLRCPRENMNDVDSIFDTWGVKELKIIIEGLNEIIAEKQQASRRIFYIGRKKVYEEALKQKEVLEGI